MENILIIDDEKNYLFILEDLLTDEGYQVFTAETAEQGLHIFQENELDVVITDMKMPGMDGMSLLERVHMADPELPVIMLTAFGSVEKAVEAMRKGAYDYIEKPFKNEELKLTIRKAIDLYHLIKENRLMSRALQERYGFSNIVGKSAPMQRVYELIEKVAPTKATVLITGESGTGKELIARAIHYNSNRRTKAFISVNCGALPESLLESELFGHEKGAFSGAVSQRKGRFEMAHGGTLFLDEISEMSPPLQVKLLRVLQEMEFERVGSSESIRVDVRVVAASNRNLKEEVAANRFRGDLFYRLNVLHIPLPPLRNRTDDIPLLVNHFLAKYCSENNEQKPLTIEQEAFRRLLEYSWPGNVRELENAVERAVILATGNQITLQDLPSEIREARFDNSMGDDSPKNMGAAPGHQPEAIEKEPFPHVAPGERLHATGLKPRHMKALEFLRVHGFITNKYYSQINDISERQALRELNEMVEAGLLERLGKGRACRYILTPGAHRD